MDTFLEGFEGNKKEELERYQYNFQYLKLNVIFRISCKVIVSAFLLIPYQLFSRCKQLEKEIEELSSQMSEAIGSVDHIPSRSDYLNMKEDLSFREVSIEANIYNAVK